MAKGLLPDTHAQSASAARSYVLRRGRRGDAGRRAPELAAVARQGQDLGRRTRPARAASSSRSTSRRPRSTATCAIDAPLIGDIGSCVVGAARRHGRRAGPSRRPTGPARIAERKDKNLSKMAETLAQEPVADELPQRAERDARHRSRPTRTRSLVNEGANTLDFARSIVDMYEPRKRLDVGTWGIMGIGMGFAVAAAVVTGKPVIAIEGDSAFGFSRHGSRDHLPLQPAGVRGRLQQQRRLPGTDVNPSGGADVAPTVFVKGARYDKMMEAFGGVGVLRHHAGRAAQGAGTKRIASRQADADQRRHRRDRRHRERPHHQPESASAAKKK